MDLSSLNVPLICGYVIAVPLLGFFTSRIVNSLWQQADLDRKDRYAVQTGILGFVERTIYYLAFVSGGYTSAVQVIGAWLALKTIPRFKTWIRDERGKEKYNTFLVGNGLSVLHVYFGFQLAQLLETQDYIEFLVLFAVVVFSTIAIHVYIDTHPNPAKKKERRNAT